MSQDSSSTSFPCLETKRLWLRRSTQEDVEAVFAVFSDPQVTQFHDLDTFAYVNEASKVIERRAKGFESGRGICSSCIITTTDQFSERNHLREPLKALSMFQFGKKGAMFGVNMIPRNSGTIRTGSLCTVL